MPENKVINSVLVALEMDADADGVAEEFENREDVVRAKVLEVEAEIGEGGEDD